VLWRDVARPRSDEAPFATDESDVAAALTRAAFIIAFAVAPGIRQAPAMLLPIERALVRAAPPVASLLCVLVFASYLWHFRVPAKRTVAIVVDLLLVTSAISAFPPSAPQRQWIASVYYLVIMVSAIWFRRSGALLVAVTAAWLDGVFRLNLNTAGSPDGGTPLPWLLINEGQMIPMVMIAVASSYVAIARDRDHQHASLLEHEMTMARRLQDRMLPDDLPTMPGIDLGLMFLPARAVGGDLYDAIALDAHRLFLCVGDMPGKSVYGLVHLSLIHSHMRAGVRRGLTPAAIAEFVNHNVYEALQPNSYAPLFLGVLDAELRTLTFVNCGHLPPLLVRGDEEPEVIELFTGSIVVGGTQRPNYNQKTIGLRPGDLIVAYTDGITEARNRKREEFGVRRMVDVIREYRDASPAELAGEIAAAANRFSGNAKGDDETVFVIRVAADAGGRETSVSPQEELPDETAWAPDPGS